VRVVQDRGLDGIPLLSGESGPGHVGHEQALCMEMPVDSLNYLGKPRID